MAIAPTAAARYALDGICNVRFSIVAVS